MKKVILITGASAGMGKSTAKILQQKGHIVYGAARRLDAMQDLKELGVQTLSLDITQENSIVSCVNTILEKEGKIDVLVNNAGYGSYGAVEDIPIEEVKRQFEVNIFGLARITQLVLPKMREQKSGRIVNISSMVPQSVLIPPGSTITTSMPKAFSSSRKASLQPSKACFVA